MRTHQRPGLKKAIPAPAPSEVRVNDTTHNEEIRKAKIAAITANLFQQVSLAVNGLGLSPGERKDLEFELKLAVHSRKPELGEDAKDATFTRLSREERRRLARTG